MCCQSGFLSITVFDDDENSEDDALGVAILPIDLGMRSPMVFDKLELKGQPQPGAFGYSFPDSEISFTISFKGDFGS